MLAMDLCAKQNRLIARQSTKFTTSVAAGANTCRWEKANAAEKVGEKGSESKRGAMHKMQNP